MSFFDAGGYIGSNVSSVFNLNYAYDEAQKFQASYVTSTNSTSSASSYTLSSLDIGEENINRTVVCTVSWNAGTVNRFLSSATIGGVTATIVQTTDAAGWERSGIIYADVPTGVTASVVLNFNGTVANGIGVGIFRLVNVSTISAGTFFVRNNSSGAYLTNVNVNAGDYVVSVIGSGGSGSTWTNTTERYSYTSRGTFEGASTTAGSTGGLTVYATGSTYGVLTTVVFG